ncbi:hypothetical protein [Streptomyces cinnamoneus]|uniref:Uncharacterized protein n=1 Tax=Streptomyces cinnamoneus TaxID=53446 RepID=A0A918TYK9_STRCJ|nr:hypothetical protein [Streptomyces cinnamoneus]GHC68952.1 hypothetical protein GCM10010507_54490 [Streptomyces cinnamoneus]
MPTPYGSRGGMAFSADELRVLRRALDIAVRPQSVPARPGPAREAEVRACLRLARDVDEAGREGARLRAFLLTDLVRYREALPGAASGYVQRLRDALAEGYRPRAEDLAALRSLCAPAAADGVEADDSVEASRRRALLARCEHLAEQAVRARLAARAADTVPPACPPPPARTHLMALPGGCTAGPDPKPDDKPAPPPAAPQPKPKPSSPRPDRPIPTPGEVFPPRRKPAPPSAARGLAAARPA